MTFTKINLVLPYESFKNSSLEIESALIYKLSLGPNISGIPEGLTLIPGIIDLHGDILLQFQETLRQRLSCFALTPLAFRCFELRDSTKGLIVQPFAERLFRKRYTTTS